RGLARKAAADTLFVLRPFARSYAAAYALFANGRKVPLDRVVYGSPENDRHLAAVAEMESEFAWLLVEASENAGFFRQKLAAPVLQDALVSTDADPWKSFLHHGLEKNLFSGRDPGEWYNTFVERRLLSMLTPLSVEFFETCYREVTTLTFKDPDGAESTCTLTGLVENWQSFPNPNGVIDDLLLKLSLLAHRAPAGMQLPLGTVRQALSRLRTEQTPEVQAQIAGAEEGLFEALRTRIDLERYLADAEARHISPADRFLRTLKAAEAARRETNFLLPAIQKKLDEWDEYR
ncbi:MAG: hypothetical protein J6Q65_03135, partial [Lentisphaeria bacterium]|nr:hypothetical protein [Lentisphaeria bacterium]